MIGIIAESTIPAQSKKDLISRGLLQGRWRELRLSCDTQPQRRQLTYGEAKATVRANQPVNIFGQRHL